MVEIGGRPILWHIMKTYDRYGFSDFVLALGYKGESVKDYFLNYHARLSDVIVHLKTGAVEYANPTAEDWHVRLVDTGLDTMTGGRLRRLRPWLEHCGTFMLTYGDGVTDLDICALWEFHRSHGRVATITGVRPAARFGSMRIDAGRVAAFKEKPQTGVGWINGGYFVFEQRVFEYLDDDRCVLEADPLERLARDGELMAFEHRGYWQCMDTVRDRDALQEAWASGRASWL